MIKYYKNKLLSNLRGGGTYPLMGFTLSEVLITLGIIGVVAALTMPTLIAKQKEKETVAKLKKVYSTLSQALLSAIADYGTVDEWGLVSSNTGEINDDGLKVLEHAGMNALADRLHKYIKSDILTTGWDKDVVLVNMHGTPLDQWYDKGEPNALRLPDGTIFIMGQITTNSLCSNPDLKSGGYCSTIVVWFPPKNKQRVEGKNQFNFYLMKNRLIPWGVSYDPHNAFEKNCKISTNNRQSGRGCTAWVLEKENMDYLHCDDLSWDGKSKCK